MSRSTPPQFIGRLLRYACRVALLSAGLWPGVGLADSAATVYREKCAACHGESGEGVAGIYDTPLFGEKSIEELTRYIDESMPQDDPGACVGPEARRVAEFIFNEFYSPGARLAVAPRVGLARLTAVQYRNAVADLVAHFTPQPASEGAADEAIPEKTGGLRAEYFQSDGMNKANELKLERVDRCVDFDFGSHAPHASIKHDQFMIIWSGSIVAPETGEYQFRIRTENGARLFLNLDPQGREGKVRDDSPTSLQAVLVDAWVGSGQLREASGRVFLLGGRRYPLRVEYFKYLDASASIRLEWKPPHGVWRVIGPDFLRPEPASRTWIVDAPLPADDRSRGFEQGSSVSGEWLWATTSAAAATADEVVSRLPLLAKDRPRRKNRQRRLGRFLTNLARVAYRRPLSPQEEHLYREEVFAEAASLEAAVRRGVLLIVASPHFLYTDLTPPDAAPSQHAVAARLAWTLWDSLPDAGLLAAADSGELATPKDIASHARRMLDDPRARLKMQGFFHHWLEIDDRDLAKDRELYPEFDDAAIADLRRSLELFVEHVMWSPESDYRELLLADYLFVNDRLRALYYHELEAGALSTAGDDEFTPARCRPNRRSGVLTHPYLLSAFAYHNSSSPIHRGVFLTRNVVGRSLKPPPVAVAFQDADFSPELTMREKITELTRESACMSCHQVINPLGFALENFDAIGRWRETEKDKPIDTRSDYTTPQGQRLQLAGARDIAQFAAADPAAHRAFVTQLFQHLVKQNPDAYGVGVVEQLRDGFAADGFNMQNLVVRIATLTSAYDPTANQLAE